MDLSSTSDRPGQGGFAALRQFVRPRREPVERCELCSQPLAEAHSHLLELERRQLLCACEPCAVLFSGAHNPRYRRVTRDVYRLDDFQLTDAQWDGLHIPINLAFITTNSRSGKVLAYYPSPAGATKSLLTLDAWQQLIDDNPVMRELEPDVEALLVHRVAQARAHYRVPIDVCFRLVGLIRTNWHGLSGGPAVWEAVAKFFAELDARAGPIPGRNHA